jgi:hypothetical protein
MQIEQKVVVDPIDFSKMRNNNLLIQSEDSISDLTAACNNKTQNINIANILDLSNERISTNNSSDNSINYDLNISTNINTPEKTNYKKVTDDEFNNYSNNFLELKNNSEEFYNEKLLKTNKEKLKSCLKKNLKYQSKGFNNSVNLSVMPDTNTANVSSSTKEDSKIEKKGCKVSINTNKISKDTKINKFKTPKKNTKKITWADEINPNFNVAEIKFVKSTKKENKKQFFRKKDEFDCISCNIF